MGNIKLRKTAFLAISATLIISAASAAIYFYHDLDKESQWLARVNPHVQISKVDIIKARLSAVLPDQKSQGKGIKLSKETIDKMSKETNHVFPEHSVASDEKEKVADLGAQKIASGVYKNSEERNLEVMKSRLETMEKAKMPEPVLASMRRYVHVAETQLSASSKSVESKNK